MKPSPEAPLAGCRIGVFGRGGSGKSTVTVLLAQLLRRRGYAVVVLDADSTNIGLAGALGFDQPPDPLIERYGGMVFSGGAVTCPVDDPTPLAGADLDLVRLEERFVARAPGVRLLVLGKMGRLGPGAGCDGPIVKLARDLRLREGDRPLVTLVDFKAGLEDSARGVLTGLDWAVVVVDPSLAALQTAVDLHRIAGQIRSGDLPATSHLKKPEEVELANDLYRHARIEGVLSVLNKVPDEKRAAFLREGLAEAGLEPAAVIRQYTALADSWLYGAALESAEAIEDARPLADQLEARAVERLHHA